MKFSDLTESIHQAWQFFVPPIINLFVLTSLTYFIAPQLLRDILTKATYLNVGFLNDEAFKKFFDFYGLSKLTPVFFVVALIVLLYLVQRFVLRIGTVLPGRITYAQEYLLLHVVTPTRLAQWWATMPDTDGAYKVVQVLGNRLNLAPSEVRSNVVHWENEYARHSRVFNTLKVYWLWTILISIVGLLTGQGILGILSKAFTITVVIVLIGGYEFVKLVYTIEQIGHACANSIDGILLVRDVSGPLLGKETIDEKCREILESRICDRFRWWEFKLFSLYDLQWFRRTFLKKGAT
jgi:hypothetical protein